MFYAENFVGLQDYMRDCAEQIVGGQGSKACFGQEVWPFQWLRPI
jgi:hypothetical protein